MNGGWQSGAGTGTILGIEVLLPNSMGRIWLEGASGLHLLYGRNGAGKSTLLNALRDFFNGQQSHQDQARARCFVRLPDTVLGGPVGLNDIAPDAAELLETITQSPDFSLLSDSPASVAPTLLNIQESIDAGTDQSDVPGLFGENEYRYLKDHPLTDEQRVGLHKVIAHENIDGHWLKALVHPWADNCFGQTREMYFTNLHEEFEFCLKALGLERNEKWLDDFDDSSTASGYDMLYSNGWEEFVRLALLLVFSSDHVLCELPYATDLYAGEGDGGVVAAAIKEVAASRLLCIELSSDGHRSAVGKQAGPGWIVSPAARLSDDTPNLNRLWSETQETIRSAINRVNPHASESTRELATTYRLIRDATDPDVFVEQLVPSLMFGDTKNLDYLLAEAGPPDHPYVAVPTPQYAASVRELPGWPAVVDCDDPLDPNSWLTERFVALFGSAPKHPPVPDPFTAEVIGHLVDDPEGLVDVFDVREDFKARGWMGPIKRGSTSDSGDTSLLWSGPTASNLEAVAEFPEFDALMSEVAEYGELLPRLDIGLGGLRVEPVWRLPAWIEGRPAHLEALDLPTDTWVRVSDLSDAQCRWVGIAIQIGEARETAAQSFFSREGYSGTGYTMTDRARLENSPAGGGAGTIALFGDEIDAGVHIAASRAIFETLSEIPGIGFVSSHSPTALRTPLVRLVNVHRDSSGRMAITSPGLGGDVEKTAHRLGVDLTDVLASMHLAIIVEGSHDRIVIEELLRGEENTDRIIVIEGRGTHSMTAVADSRLLVDYCDLRVLIVLDNVDNARFKPVLESLQDLCAQNQPVGKAIKESGLELLRSESTPEERALVEILERGARRGILDRIDIHGLPARDIAELLPSNSFGLEKDWSDYGKEFRSAGRGRDFKTWLREEYGVSISQKSIRKAITGLDQMTDGLIDLHQALLVAAALASRDRGLSTTAESHGPLP